MIVNIIIIMIYYFLYFDFNCKYTKYFSFYFYSCRKKKKNAAIIIKRWLFSLLDKNISLPLHSILSMWRLQTKV